MELVRYWRIVAKRLWIVVLLLAVVLAARTLAAPSPDPGYAATLRVVVGVAPEPPGDYYRYDLYYSWLTAEYLVDDLAEVVKSSAFALDVALASGLDVPVGAIQGATASGKLHRILTIHIYWPVATELEALAAATVEVLTERGHTYFAQLGSERASVAVIDGPTIVRQAAPLRQRLDLPLRLLLSLLAGIALAFFLDYIDLSIRDRHDLEALGLPLLGEVPSHRRAWLWPWRRRAP